MMRETQKKLLQLFITFLKIGAFTFGGGYAMLPLIEQQVLANGWMTDEQIMNFIAVSESTPGPFAINIATYVGVETAGFFGALCATLGVVTPSFIIILIVARFFLKFKENKIVSGCMTGLKPAVIGLIASAVLSMGKTVFVPLLAGVSPLLIVTFAIFALMLVLALKKINPVFIIVISAAFGIASGYLLKL